MGPENPEVFRIPDGDKEASKEDQDGVRERVLADEDLVGLLREYGEDGWEEYDGQALINVLYTILLTEKEDVDPDDFLEAKGILE